MVWSFLILQSKELIKSLVSDLQMETFFFRNGAEVASKMNFIIKLELFQFLNFKLKFWT